ncbi:major facilitator superfamily domain-containing protein [Melampsora americana]|nr:major facilitator superfamily domain-containing protein [Melampsora americana]
MWPFNKSRSDISNTITSSSNSSAPDERSPLVSIARNNSTRNTSSRQRTPLPVKQLLVLCIMRLTEPISYTLIFPFINQMLEEMKVSPDPKQIGYYAGVIESLFAVAQLCTAMFWGRLSDQVGRKPVMLIGLFGMAISVIAFGLQKTYLGLIISRFVAGMMNGNIAILQSIVAEITDPTNYADAVSLLPLSFAIGSIVGPIVGGFLALPAQNFPLLFGNCSFLIEYPYFLPCLVGGMLNFLAIILGIFCLEETLETKRKPQNVTKRPSPSQGYEALTSADPNSRPNVSHPPSIRSLCTEPIMTLMLTFTMIHITNVAIVAVIPLYAYTKVLNGGLGMTLEQIGFILSVNGIGLIFVQLFIFPPLQRRFGAVNLYKWLVPTFTITYLCLPIVTYLVHLKGNTTTMSLVYMTVVMIIRSPGVMCYVCSTMLVKMLSPSSTSLGTLNGIMQTCRAFAQAVGPMLGTSLFAISISTGILGGNLVWIVLAMISVLAQLCSRRIPNEIDKPKEQVISEEDGVEPNV